jgi:hypothetical protein
MAKETGIPAENRPQYRFVHNKSNIILPGLEPGPPQWDVGD